MMVLEGRPVEGEWLLDVPLAEEDKRGKFQSPTGGNKSTTSNYYFYSGLDKTTLEKHQVNFPSVR